MQHLYRMFYVQLPGWSRPDHPILQYALRHRRRRRARRRRAARWSGRLSVFLGLAGSVMIGRVALSARNSPAAFGPDQHSVHTVLYLPLLTLQLVALALALAWCWATMPQRDHWQAFKVTTHGLQTLMYARWAALFYRLGPLLAVLMVPRLCFAAEELVMAMRYRGHLLNLYTMGESSVFSTESVTLLMAALMTAALIQFPVLWGLNAAISLYISAACRRWATGLALHLMVFLGEFMLFWLAWDALQRTQASFPRVITEGRSLDYGIDLLLIGTAGDQGLWFMDFETALQMWTVAHFCVPLSGIWLAMVAIEGLLARSLLHEAARLVARPLAE